MSDNINVYVKIEIKISSLINEDDLQNVFGGDIEKCVKDVIKDEGHFIGLMDDNYKILSVEKE